jgi:hypothetical protein
MTGYKENIFILPTRIVSTRLQRIGRNDAPKDRFWEPYLKPTTPLSSVFVLQREKNSRIYLTV